LGELFGTDGVRGVANQDLTPELAFQLGKSGAYVLSQYNNSSSGNKGKVLLGRDTRLSGDMLAAALIAGINAVGVEVVDLGIVPTPAVSYLSRTRPALGGIMVSASHNPIEDNGIKFFDDRGIKISAALEEQIEENLNSGLPRPTHEQVGRKLEGEYLLESYLDQVLRSFSSDISELKIILDCGNGAAYRLAPELFKLAGVDNLQVINNSGQGELINVNCGSTDTAELKERVLTSKADIGIALDGDADRTILVDEKGQEIDGDYILYICAKHLAQRNKLADKKIVATKYSNLGLSEALKKEGVEVIYAANGDKYVLAKLQELDLSLGGEKSGHIIFRDHNVSGDGMLTALQVMEVMVNENKPLSQLAQGLEEWPQLLENVKVAQKEELEDNKAIKSVVKEGREELTQGRIFIRASGTEPVIRLMLEGKDLALLKKWKDKIAAVIAEELN